MVVTSFERATIHYMKGSKDSFLRASGLGCRIQIESHGKRAGKEPLYAALGPRVPVEMWRKGAALYLNHKITLADKHCVAQTDRYCDDKGV